jgi:hypothetical protein
MPPLRVARQMGVVAVGLVQGRIEERRAAASRSRRHSSPRTLRRTDSPSFPGFQAQRDISPSSPSPPPRNASNCAASCGRVPSDISRSVGQAPVLISTIWISPASARRSIRSSLALSVSSSPVSERRRVSRVASASTANPCVRTSASRRTNARPAPSSLASHSARSRKAGLSPRRLPAPSAAYRRNNACPSSRDEGGFFRACAAYRSAASCRTIP